MRIEKGRRGAGASGHRGERDLRDAGVAEEPEAAVLARRGPVGAQGADAGRGDLASAEVHEVLALQLE
ncbi:MAG: hypothetical protein FD126_3763, partial [Elusimicrobia bacterium]